MRKTLGHFAFALTILVAGTVGGWWLTGLGLGSIQELRQLERVPASKVAAALPGEINLTATTQSLKGNILRSHHTNTPSLYYRYRHEVETRDSDGNRRWSTRQDFDRAVGFLLLDDSGSIRIAGKQDLDAINWSVAQSYQTVQGSNRYTEWRIEPNSEVFVFGKAVSTGGDLVVRFHQAGFYTPTISNHGQYAEQQNMGSIGLFALWGGLALLGLGVLGLVLLLKVHRLLVFLSILTSVLALVLTHLALSMMQQDIGNGLERYAAQTEAATRLVEKRLQSTNQSWRGWQDAGDFLDAPYQHLTHQQQLQLHEVRLTLAVAQQRLMQQMQTIPERWLLPLWGYEPPAALPGLPERELGEIADRLQAIPATRLTAAWLWAAIPGGLLLAVLLTWLGFRQVRYKRLMENVPTSLTAGVSCGLAEVQGSLVLEEDEKALRSPYTNSPCAWYYYKKEERRGSGKNAKWVTLEQKTDYLPFYAKDEEGLLAIDARDAEVISRFDIVERQGRLRYTERTLRMGDSLYAIGQADVDDKRGDRLMMVRGDKSGPFILSNFPETHVLLMKARRGMFYLTLAFSGVLLALLLTFASAGGFAATDFLLAAMAAPAYMLLVTLILHYNDLIFLERRAQRNWANIQVSLKKRHNLIPNLEKLCKSYLAHEKEIMLNLANLRKLLTLEKQGLGRYLAAEQATEQQLQAVLENYPELKGDKVVAKLMQDLTRAENEVALFRCGYNDAVEIYNARIATVPDIFFARALGFHRLEHIVD